MLSHRYIEMKQVTSLVDALMWNQIASPPHISVKAYWLIAISSWSCGSTGPDLYVLSWIMWSESWPIRKHITCNIFHHWLRPCLYGYVMSSLMDHVQDSITHMPCDAGWDRLINLNFHSGQVCLQTSQRSQCICNKWCIYTHTTTK